ncbi:MAG: cellulase family glycosylhydrolase, partial [Ahrensia sp.]|nr:cellulase family glycosylhydrolase [Ahrensia sp.]
MNDFKTPLIARAGFVLAFLLTSIATAHSATFGSSRGIAMEMWVTWPASDRWNDAEVVDNFPEWQKFVSDDDIRDLKQKGLTTVRIPIDPAMFLFSDDSQREGLLFEGIHRAVKRILDAGLTAIVDLHTISYGNDGPRIGIDQVQNDDRIFIKYKALVEKFAAQLRIYDPRKVAFELINEPNYACDDRDTKNLWNAQLAQLHGAARAVNTDITLILTGACYGSAAGLTLLDPTQFNDTNIIWSFHNYEPFILTHQSAGWVGQPVGSFKNLPYPPNLLEPKTVEFMP